ncbi:ROK family protein [uncultured Clostridium sp.]|mgnify:CR=1 FL=1|uniref:ROK family protein n=1 Tax=uncultured Clostridium sp. TaxID=59620 RepID=UPI0025CC1A23|nr:ROK family protein [uncultured Clostridium sp.]
MNYIGVDLGGTNIVVGLVDEEGKIIKSISRPTEKERGVEPIFDDIFSMCNELIDELNLDKTSLKGIGMGIPGTVDDKNGIIVYAPNIKMDNFNVREYAKGKIDYEIRLANDADSAGLGEVVAGSAKGCSDAIVVTLGTGVGGGIIINGKIFPGFYPGGAEVGHQIIEVNGRQCGCGKKGCFEAYSSASALILAAKKKAEENKDSLLYKLVEGDLEKMNAKVPFDADQAGDKAGHEVIEEYLDYLSIGISNLITIFNPEAILLGGGVCKQGENLTVPLKERIEKLAFGGELKTQIKIASLGNDAGLIGAAMLTK